MAALSTDKLKKLSRKWVGQIGSGGVTDAVVTTIPLASATNLATDTAVVATIDRVDANGVATPAKEESVIGVVSGSNLATCVRQAEGTAQTHSAGAVVEILITAKGYNDIIDAFLVEHTQLGVHDATKVVTLTGTQTLTNKTLTTPIFQGSVDGWISANETWTYATASTITVPSGAASKYQKGDKIKLTQTTVKCFYIITVADTVLTITGGSDYTLTNAAISANYYSKVANPLGFPYWFVVTAPTFTVATYDNGSGGQPTTIQSRFRIDGNTYTALYYGSGVKAGSVIHIATTANSYPAAAYASAVTVGICNAFTSVSNLGKVQFDTGNIDFYFEVTIPDNTTITDFWYQISYEYL